MTTSSTSRPAPGTSLVVGEWTVRPSLGELRRDDEVAHVEPKTMAVLLYLAEHPRKVCSRKDLLRAVWGDAFVTEEVLTHAIWELRRLLGDDARNPRYIQTVPKRGYRLVAEISRTEARADHEAAAPETAGPDIDGSGTVGPETTSAEAQNPPRAEALERRPGKGAASRWGVAGLVVLGAAVALLWATTRGNPPSSEPGAITSLAVLPFDNMIADPEQQYFVDGMHEALITDLSKIGALKVISRTSTMRYRAARKSIPEIAEELGVDALVEGSVLLAGADVRIAAQLIDGRSDEHLWAENYTRPLEDVLALHSEISRAIAREIEATLTADEADRLAASSRVNPRAFEAYLRGLYEWNKRTPEGFEQAAEFFQEAIAIQSDYAEAWGGLANTYVLLGNYEVWERDRAYAAGRAAAMRALELDDSVAEALTALGTISLFGEWNWSQAEQEFRRAIELRPNYATAHQYLAELLAYTGRREEAIEQVRIALALDPLSRTIASAGGEVHLLTGRFDDAIPLLQRALEVDPGFWRTHRELGKVYVAQERYAEAVKAFENSIALLGSDRRERDELACAYAGAGRRDEAIGILEELRAETPPRSWDVGVVSVCLGETEEALTWLERAVEERAAVNVSYLGSHPWLDPIRNEPRFQALMEQLNYPD